MDLISYRKVKISVDDDGTKNVVIVQSIFVYVVKGLNHSFFFADSSLERCQSTEGTREASQINEPDMQDTPESEVCLLDNESTNMENDSDVFHSLENSAATTDSISNSVVDSADVSSESPLKKQRVCSPDKKSEEVTSIQVDCLEVKEEVTSDLRTWKTESNLQNCITVQEARVADTVEARHVVEEEDSTVVAVVQKMHEKNFKPVDTAEVDVEITEESVTVTVAGGKHSEFWKSDSDVTVCHKTNSYKPLLMLHYHNNDPVKGLVDIFQLMGTVVITSIISDPSPE
jgi:hypothetical protein